MRCRSPRLDSGSDGLDVSGQQVKRFSGSEAPRIRRMVPADAAIVAQHCFLEMFARAYFPGRTGQLMIVPSEGDFITRPDPNVAYMHGSPWVYDVSIPLMFAGPAVLLDACRATGCGANACGCARRPDAADCDRPCIAGFAEWFCSTESGHANSPGWHASGLLRSVRRGYANAHRHAGAAPGSPRRRLTFSRRTLLLGTRADRAEVSVARPF